MIYYLCPDYDVPSWGIGMIYYHVSFLAKNNVQAVVLHEKSGFRISWLQEKIPIMYRDSKISFQPSDILIVPDVFIEEKWVRSARCRKILFVQNAFILFERVFRVSGLNDAGFERVFYYMPHLRNVLSQYFDVPLIETPAFIAEYYFKEKEFLNARKKQILVYPKFNNRDYAILEKLLNFEYFKEPQGLLKAFRSKQAGDWKVIFIKDFSHRQVAELMKEASFFVNINTHEAFNSSVPEAMAAGCINLTYEAFGPGDFLTDGVNAFVYPNNYIFALFETLKRYTTAFEEEGIQEQLRSIRENAYNTAMRYTMQNAEREILKVHRELSTINE